MKPRAVLEVMIVTGLVGLTLELAEAHVWIIVAAGVAAVIWLLKRHSYQPSHRH